MERTYATPLLDKLGVRPGGRVVILGVDDPGFRSLLAERTADVTEISRASEGEPGAAMDLVFLGADDPVDLRPLQALRGAIFPDGAIWVVSRKGRDATLRDVQVIAAARDAGLVDNKVVAFSATHTSLRLVVPRADRAGPRRRADPRGGPPPAG